MSHLFLVLSSYVTFDIVLGSMYMVVALIEAYGVFAAVKVYLYPFANIRFSPQLGKDRSCQDIRVSLRCIRSPHNGRSSRQLRSSFHVQVATHSNLR